MRAFGLLLLLLTAAVPGLAFYDGGAVTVLTPANIKDTLKKGPALVEFYAPW